MIWRSRKHPTRGSTVELLQNIDRCWRELTCRLKVDTQEKIRQLIGRSERVLRHSIFLTSGLTNRFTSLSYPDRVRIIEEISDVEIYSAAGKLAEKEFGKVEQLYMELSVSRNILTSDEQKCNSRLEKIDKEIEETRLSIEPQLVKLKSSLASLLQKRKEAEHEERYGTKEYDSTVEQLTSMRQKYEVADREHGSAKLRMQEATGKVQAITAMLKREVANVRDGLCVVCGSPIEGAPLADTIAAHEQELEQALEEANAKEVTLEAAALRFEDLRRITQHLNDQQMEMSRKLTNTRKAVAHYREQEVEIKGEMAKLRDSTRVLQARRQEVLAQLAEAQEELKLTCDRIALQVDRLELLGWLKDAFSTTGIRAHVLFEQTLPYLNLQIKSYSEQLGRPCSLFYKRNKAGELEDKIDIEQPGQRSYKGNSAGEKRMVDLAVQCALNDLAIATGGSKVNLLVCDEVIDPLDETVLGNFVRILKSKSAHMSVLLMAHRPFLDTIIPHKLRLVKRGGITQLDGAPSSALAGPY